MSQTITWKIQVTVSSVYKTQFLYHNTVTATFPTWAYYDKKQQEKKLLVPKH